MVDCFKYFCKNLYRIRSRDARIDYMVCAYSMESFREGVIFCMTNADKAHILIFLYCGSEGEWRCRLTESMDMDTMHKR